MAKKKTSATRLIVYLLIGLVVVVGALAGLRAAGVLGEKDTSLVVEVADIERRNITQMVTASGKIQPEIEVKISPDVPGEIVALPINEGDYVEQGQLLVRIRQDDYAAQVERGEASVLQSKAMLAQRRADMLIAEIELKRQRGLFDKQAVSESEFQRTESQFEVAKAGYEAAEYSVRSSEAQLKEVREQLAKTAIYAPMSGTISMLDVELGERVVGTSQMAGTEMMRLAKLDQMEIEVDVNENDVVNVTLNDSALIEVDAYPERGFRGVVTEIANSARVTGAGTQEQVTNFPVKIRIVDTHNLDEKEGMAASRGVRQEEVPPTPLESPNFRPGMSGTVDVFTETVRDAIVIPIQAVTVRDFNRIKAEAEASDESATPMQEVDNQEAGVQEAGEPENVVEDLRKVIFVMVDGKAQMLEVETGISDDTHIEIKSGLTGTEKVIIGPYSAISRQLEPDAAVKLEERKGRPAIGPR
ncbi:MAG: efflux RND transporter periplasmic adaptor subunit [Rhodothermales bacterium]|nr:efflux RND transporter periplasmic adaptor subunit [Rhodothermales bacterium]